METFRRATKILALIPWIVLMNTEREGHGNPSSVRGSRGSARITKWRVASRCSRCEIGGTLHAAGPSAPVNPKGDMHADALPRKADAARQGRRLHAASPCPQLRKTSCRRLRGRSRRVVASEFTFASSTSWGGARPPRNDRHICANRLLEIEATGDRRTSIHLRYFGDWLGHAGESRPH